MSRARPRAVFCHETDLSPARARSGRKTRPALLNIRFPSAPTFSNVMVDLNTMVKRPIINTRDEPHADHAKFRRLHVIVGDANMAELSTYLKVGTLNLCSN